MASNRTSKSIKNVIFGTGYQIFVIIINFISRSIFIRILGSNFLGINSLFSNILTVLSLAELGVGTAMVYCLYEPIANSDIERIAILINYFKKVYRVIALVVFLSGIVIIPFLGYIVNLENDIVNLNIYYLLFLINTVVSYLCMYKTLILTADQKNYILQTVRGIFDFVRIVLQILVLLVFENYLWFLLVQISASILNNIVAAMYVTKKYPYINNKHSSINKNEKSKIWNNVKAMFSYKLGGVILNNTDQLLISIIVSTECVGLYSNYYLPIKSVMGVTSAIFIAVQSSIGNLAVERDSNRQYEIFKILDIVSFWVYGIFFIGFAALLQDFITLWIGGKYLLSNYLVIIISSTYYLTGVLYPIWCYRETVGLFQQTKNIMFVTSFINIFLSIILGKLYGIEGILFATIIARVITNVWYEPYKLFRVYFKKPVRNYYFEKIIQCMLLFLILIIVNYVNSFIIIDNLLIQFLVKGIITVIVTTMIMFFYSVRKPESKEIFGIINKICFNKFKK